MKAKTFVIAVLVLFCAVALVAQQTKVSVVNSATPAKAPSDTAADAAKAPAKAAVKRTAEEPVSGDAAYKANCTRCHAEPKKFSERKMATIMQHMRVRANMTEAETQAILRYLTK